MLRTASQVYPTADFCFSIIFVPESRAAIHLSSFDFARRCRVPAPVGKALILKVRSTLIWLGVSVESVARPGAQRCGVAMNVWCF